MQGTKAQSFGVSGGGGTPFTQVDAAALCAGLPEKHYYAGLLKWGVDQTVERNLVLYLLQAVAGIAGREKWTSRKGRLEALCMLAVNELGHPERYTDAAHQRNLLFMRVDGSYPAPWETRLVFLGQWDIQISKSQWYAVWSKRYEAVFAMLDGWAGNAYRHVSRVQQEDYCDEC